MSKEKQTKVKKVAKKSKLKRFSIETINTFYEVHIVHAENEEQAKRIASEADYNASKWLGQQVVNTQICGDDDLTRFKKLDDYFFAGSATVDAEGNLFYLNEDGTRNKNMMQTAKIF